MGRGQGQTATLEESSRVMPTRSGVRRAQVVTLRQELAAEIRREALMQAELERPQANEQGQKTSLVFEHGQAFVLTFTGEGITRRALSDVVANNPEILRQAYADIR